LPEQGAANHGMVPHDIKVATKSFRSREARRDEVTRDATKLVAIFGDEAHDEARRRLIGAMAGDGVWSRVRAEIDRRTGYETGVPASAQSG
jgi:hypothetical protein